MTHWLSIDPGKRSGVAYWSGSELLTTAVVRPVGTKGMWCVEGGAPICLAKLREHEAWRWALIGTPSLVVIEDPHGPSKSAIASLAERRGYIRALAEAAGAKVELVNTSTWRRCAEETWGCSWASARQEDRIKALSVSLVAEHYGHTVSADEAEAVLIGHAALRMRVAT